MTSKRVTIAKRYSIKPSRQSSPGREINIEETFINIIKSKGFALV